MLDAYFDGFMIAPSKPVGAQTEPDWTIKGAQTEKAGTEAASHGAEVGNGAGLTLKKEPEAPVV